MDQQDMRELATSSPRDFLAAFPDGAIIDEVQKIPELFHAVKQVVDFGVFLHYTFPGTEYEEYRQEFGEDDEDVLSQIRACFVTFCVWRPSKNSY